MDGCSEGQACRPQDSTWCPTTQDQTNHVAHHMAKDHTEALTELNNMGSNKLVCLLGAGDKVLSFPVQARSFGQAHARHVTCNRNKGTVVGVFWTSTWKVVLDMCCANEKRNQWCWICTCAPQARRWQASRQRLPRQEMPQRCQTGCGSRPGSGSPSHLAHTPPHPAATQQDSRPDESPVAMHPADPLICRGCWHD